MANYNFAGGEGTATQPFLIATPVQLAQLVAYVNEGDANYNNKYYKLTANIDLSAYGANFNNGKGWIPIGISNNDFKGFFDGNGYTVSNLYINDRNCNNAGLFGKIVSSSTAKVQNLGIIDINIKAGICVGGIAGTLIGCVTNCYATGKIDGDREVGGIAGYVIGNSITNCYATVAVSGSNAGGVAGRLDNSILINCYSTGEIGGGNNVGGIAGAIITSELKNCAALNPSVKSQGSNVGRVVGWNNDGTLLNNIAFYCMLNDLNIITWRNKGATSCDGEDVSKEDIEENGTLGGRFTAVNGWTTANGKLPGFFGKTIDIPAHLYTPPSPFAGGNGTAANPYLIATPEQLTLLAHANYISLCFKLTAHIDLSAYGANYNNGKGWIPIGKSGAEFYGDFNGNGYTISNLYINNTSLNYAGLFGRINQKMAKIHNLGVVGINIKANHSVGGVVGEMINNAIVTNCYTTGTIIGNNNVGGVVGYMLSAIAVTNCYSTVAVSGQDYVGGIAGFLSSPCATNCIALNPSVKATGNFVGRIVGKNNGALSNNAAFDGVLNNANNATWNNKGPSGCDGADISKDAINADGTLGGRFTATNGWTTVNGKLPGFLGHATDMPAHLFISIFTSGSGTDSDPYIILSATELTNLAEKIYAGHTVYDNKYYKVLMLSPVIKAKSIAAKKEGTETVASAIINNEGLIIASAIFNAGGNGTIGAPYLITTKEQIVNLAQEIAAGNTAIDNKYYKVVMTSLVKVDKSIIDKKVDLTPVTSILNKDDISTVTQVVNKEKLQKIQ